MKQRAGGRLSPPARGDRSGAVERAGLNPLAGAWRRAAMRGACATAVGHVEHVALRQAPEPKRGGGRSLNAAVAGA